MTAAAPLEVQRLTKSFPVGGGLRRARVHAVDDVSFELRPGSRSASFGRHRTPQLHLHITAVVLRILENLYGLLDVRDLQDHHGLTAPGSTGAVHVPDVHVGGGQPIQTGGGR